MSLGTRAQGSRRFRAGRRSWSHIVSRYIAEALEPRRLLASIVVSNTQDSGAGSFRQALIDANSGSADDTISFDTSGVFATAQTISLLSPLPQISSASGPLTITGPGAANLTIRRDAGAAGFRVLSSAAPSLTISGVTISGGNDLTTGGGGLAVSAASGITPKVSLDGVVFSGNSTSESGGAIAFLTAGYLSLTNSTISGNSAADSGGGIYFFSGGSFFINTCTLNNNSAFGTEAGAGGGALYFFGVTDPMAPLPVLPGTLVVLGSTINNNTASSAGGGIEMRLFTGELHVQNSTVVQNTAATSGGAVCIDGGGGSLFVENSTIFGNTASSTAAGTGGGGIARVNSTLSASITVANSVVSGDTNASAPDIFRTSAATTVNVNFSAVGSATGFVLTGGNNVPFGTNLHLNALANNGGPTLTMLPVFLSPLIEGGSKDLMQTSFPNDQRGPGFQRITDTEVDIGAVEQQSQSFVVTNNNDSGAGSLRDVMQKSQTNPASDTITFDPTFFNVSRTISLLSSPTPITGNSGGVTIIGPGTSQTGAYLLTVRCDPSVNPFTIFNFGGTSYLSGFLVSRASNAVAVVSTVVSLDNMFLIGNTGTTESHGVNVGGFLRITNSKITNMNGSGILYGGGGGLLMDSCTIASNVGGVSTGNSGGGITFGGAVDGNPPKGFGFSQDSLVIRNSTISDNTATGNGGGFNMVSFTGTLLLQNSTIMRNSTNGSGGGVYIQSGSGSVTLQNCTVFGNPALANSSTTGGGGIARVSTTGGTITVANSVISGNNNTPAPDIRASSATTTNINFSLLGTSAGYSLSGSSGNNLTVGTPPQFTVDHAALGGSTTVVAIAPTSPLINAGSNALASAFSTDQRGPGFARISDGIVDIGSLERQSYIVTTTADSGLGSLRNALNFADSDPSADEIDFDTSGVFATPQTISLLTEPEGVGNPLTIVGPGSSRLTIQQAPAVPAFRFLIDSSPSLTISGVTISGFSTTTTSGQKIGGAIWALSTLPLITLDDVVLNNNTAGTDGGAIAFTAQGFLAIRNSVLSNNTATGTGGAVSMAAGGLIVVENTTFSGNTANGATGGGAISFTGQAIAAPPAGFISATLDIHTSTFSGNTATTGPGGAFALTTFTGTLLVRNSTFANNSAASSGGGVALVSGSGAITVQDSTISSNTASGSTAGTGGGGIARTSTTSSTVTIANSIVSGDTNSNAPDILAAAGTTTNVNFSAVGSATGFALSGTSGNNLLFGANLQLGALAGNGGPTQTMLPAAGSPLINAGSNLLIGGAIFTDQRGGQFSRIQGGTVDIGAVETQPAPPAVALSSFLFATAPIVLAFTFTQDVSASLSSGDLQVQLDGDGMLGGITYIGYDTPTNTATFTLPQAISDGNYCAQFVPGSVANANGSVPSSFEFDFFALNGDANHDRVVNALDFNALATNFGQSGRSYAQGDFNYDGTVNTMDFTALASQFTKRLDPPLNSPAATSPTPAAASHAAAPDLFSATPIQSGSLDRVDALSS